MAEFLVGLTLSEQMFQIHIGTGLGHFRPRTQLDSHELAICHIKRPVYLTVPPAANKLQNLVALVDQRPVHLRELARFFFLWNVKSLVIGLVLSS